MTGARLAIPESRSSERVEHPFRSDDDSSFGHGCHWPANEWRSRLVGIKTATKSALKSALKKGRKPD
jgi:hypothetical protein